MGMWRIVEPLPLCPLELESAAMSDGILAVDRLLFGYGDAGDNLVGGRGTLISESLGKS